MPDGGLSEAEELRLQQRLYDLLAGQSRRYLAGESTSMPQQTAERLLASLTYTLRAALDSRRLPVRELLTCDLDALLRQGQGVLRQELGTARALWQKACLNAPAVQNSFYADSLAGLGVFFERYDLWYFADEVPALLDYPLCVPVPGTERGVGYAVQWLRRLLLEDALRSRFTSGEVRRVLAAADPGWRHACINLCEQPADNALGRVLAGLPGTGLAFDGAVRGRVLDALGRSPDLKTPLRAAARRLSGQLGVSPAAAQLLEKIALGLEPRLAAALPAGRLEHVFVW